HRATKLFSEYSLSTLYIHPSSTFTNKIMSLPETQGKTLPDAWDYKGRPADRSKTGGWISSAMILGGEACERLTTLGVAFNLVTYMTDTMHGVTILTISTIIPGLRPPKCVDNNCIQADGKQLGVLYLALYLLALGTGGVKSSVSGFGSDQFDESDQTERKQMNRFFSWFFFLINLGSLAAVTVLVYIQDNLGRRWGYGICACAIVLGLIVFLSGTRRYRFKKLAGSPLTQIAAVFVAAWHNRRVEEPSDSSAFYNVDDLEEGSKKKKQKLPRSKYLSFLDKAAIKNPEVTKPNKWNLQTLTDVEEDVTNLGHDYNVLEYPRPNDHILSATSHHHGPSHWRKLPNPTSIPHSLPSGQHSNRCPNLRPYRCPNRKESPTTPTGPNPTPESRDWPTAIYLPTCATITPQKSVTAPSTPSATEKRPKTHQKTENKAMAASPPDPPQGKTLPDAWDYKGRPAERYLTIAIFATVQATGVTILTISTIIPGLRPPKCTQNTNCIQANETQLTVLYLALYLTALGTGGLKSSVSGFGSDQFDDTDPKEKHQMTNFFNWFFFLISLGSLCAVTILVYIQDNKGREWGYGICACAIVLGLVVFLAGTKRYRFKKLVGSPLTQIAAVFVAAWKKRDLELPSDVSLLYNVDDIEEGNKKKKQELPHSKQFRFLDKAAIKEPGMTQVNNKWNLSTLTDVEEVKLVLRMLPIWATTIMFWTIYAQMTTFSVSQATTMDRHIGKSFQIPPASLTVFFVGSILLTVPIYDRIIVPIARKLLKNPQGLTPLQRIGVGLVFSILSMVAGALTEVKRLRAARSHGLTDDPTAVIPLSVFWLVPQFFFVGSGEAFTYIGQLDFFLRECPKGMKTMSTGLFLSTLSLGFFFSSLLVSIVHKVTGNSKPWLADNLNQGRLHYFYWLLAILSTVNFVIYMLCARWYVYKDKRLAEQGIELNEADEPTFH
ncbi:hypothetical protein Tsubulata_033153, partial [Turnera subulata]